MMVFVTLECSVGWCLFCLYILLMFVLPVCTVVDC